MSIIHDISLIYEISYLFPSFKMLLSFFPAGPIVEAGKYATQVMRDVLAGV